MRYIPLALVLACCLAAAPATQPEKPMVVTPEQLLKLVPKEAWGPAGVEWNPVQVKRFNDAFERVLTDKLLGKLVTFRAMPVVVISLDKDNAPKVQLLNISLSKGVSLRAGVVAVLAPGQKKDPAKLQAGDRISISGRVGKVAANASPHPAADGFLRIASFGVEMSDANY